MNKKQKKLLLRIVAAAVFFIPLFLISEGIVDVEINRWALLALGIGIANIPDLTVTNLFLFYCTLRATTLLPTVLTLAGKKLSGAGVFAGVVTSFCIGLPVFAYGNLHNLAAWKTAGSLLTVLLSGALALAFSRREARQI